MNPQENGRSGSHNGTDVFGTPGRVEAAMNRSIRDALRRHKLLGESIPVWRDGKVVIVPPEEIVVPDLPDEPPTAAPRPGDPQI